MVGVIFHLNRTILYILIGFIFAINCVYTASAGTVMGQASWLAC